MRISDWISDVCSSDLAVAGEAGLARFECDLPPAALAELHRFGGAVEPDRQTIGPSRPAGGAGPAIAIAFQFAARAIETAPAQRAFARRGDVDHAAVGQSICAQRAFAFGRGGRNRPAPGGRSVERRGGKEI